MSMVLLVTGGGRGIGAAISRKAAAQGFKVAINYANDKKSAEDLAASLGNAVAIAGDVSKPDDVVQMFDETEKRLGPVTHLVNNAGITGKSSRLDAASPETIATCIAVNLTGSILVAREAVRRMATRHGGKGGVIVNISSAATTIGSPGEYVWYAASKGAIDAFTIGLAKEVIDDGIRVNAVAPGMTETEIHALSSGDPGRVERIRPTIPMKRIGKPEEIADAVMFLLNDTSSYMAGVVVRVAGGR